MGYPGDEGGSPPDTRAGAVPRRTAVWASGTDQEWPTQASARPGDAAALEETRRYRAPSGDDWGPAAASSRPQAGPPPPGYLGRQPASPSYQNAITGQPPRPPQPGGRAPAGSPEPSRASHRRAAGPAADARPPSGADPPRGRDDRGRRAARSAAPPADREAAASRENAWRRPPSQRSGDEIQGGTRPGGRTGTGPQAGGSLWSSGAFRTAGPAGRGPVRGFPPAPGAPDPVYPPGQFSPWNSAELRTAAGHPNHSVGLGPELAEPGYSQLAVSDPAADATATQTWAVLDEAQLAGEWTRPAGNAPSPPDAGARGPFDAADAAAASPPWFAGQPGTGEPAGLTGPAAVPGPRPDAGRPDLGHPDPGRPDPAPPGQPGAPGSPRPGGRLAARRSREAAALAVDPPVAPAVAPRTGGFDTGGFDTGGFDTGGFDTGSFGAPAEPDRWADRDASPPGMPRRGSRSAARRRTPRKPRKPVSRARMWLMPAGMLILVGVLITVVYLQFGTGHSGTTGATSASQQPTPAASSAPPGPWKHITTRQDDPTALTLAELFPARFTAGASSAVRTAQRAAGANCAKLVLGGKLQAALRKGGCTQVMRASYLSTGQKIMATIGVLNLANVTDSEQAGKATGGTAFIKQLPGAKGPTRNLMKGTGLEEAEIKGHYLILTWAEFTNLKAPKGPKQRAQLDAFSRALVGSTANVSLTSRMLLGKPATS